MLIWLSGIEAPLVVKLNHAFAQYSFIFNLYDAASNNNFFRGLPIFFVLSYVWFRNVNDDRLRVVLGLLGVCIATLASVYLQTRGFNFRLRPLIDPDLDIKISSFNNRD